MFHFYTTPYKKIFESTYQTPTWNIILLKKNCGNWSNFGMIWILLNGYEKNRLFKLTLQVGVGEISPLSHLDASQGIVHTDSYTGDRPGTPERLETVKFSGSLNVPPKNRWFLGVLGLKFHTFLGGFRYVSMTLWLFVFFFHHSISR